MRASIRRIDLTQAPAAVDAWPAVDWLNPESTSETTPSAPRGRGGLWAAMANAVARAREASSSTDEPFAADADVESAEVIDLVAEAPHLAYLARVACSSDLDDEVADVIDFDASRARDLR
jgi:hypothetical protein